ncbi:MAG TPA: inorganic phosphate transporter [Candidatus Dormibacteraeota bacterium]|jgi:PiT family inorganic phosphate transporter
MVEPLLILTFLVALVFDFTNGFHDTPMAVATSISTRALSPRHALLIAAVLNLAGAIITVAFFQAKVSNTIAKLLVIKPGLVVIIAGLVGAIAWNLFTWSLGLPSSSSHAFIGGLLGAGVAAGGGFSAIHWSQLGSVFLALITSPVVGFFGAGTFVVILLWAVQRGRPGRLNRNFRRLQVPAAAFVAFSHGSNDAQKTMAAMTLALVATGHLAKFKVPLWVVVLSAAAIAAGTYVGGWRIMRTLGWGMFKLEPATGMSAQVMGATVIQVATQLGLPVSTTHTITGSVMGAGAGRQFSALRLNVVADIVGSWILTIPATATIAWVMFAILHTAGLNG